MRLPSSAAPRQRAWSARRSAVSRSRVSIWWIAARQGRRRVGPVRVQASSGLSACLPCVIYMPAGIYRSMEICLREFDLPARARYAARMSILSQNIERLRRHLGDKQKDFADRFGMGQSAVSKWVNPGKEPSTDAMLKLAELASTSVDRFRSEPWHPGQRPEAQAIVLMPVSLPSEAALTRMFEALLDGRADPGQVDELAETLAQRLPAALARAVDSPAVPVRDEGPDPGEGAPPRAKRRQPLQPERRT
jgi:transcriptional regulator with XRE-family HTH domain